MQQLEKLGHIALRVGDIERSRDFYAAVLNMKVTSENPETGECTLGLEPGRRDIVLCRAPTAERPDGEAPGLLHFAWRLEDFRQVQHACRALRGMGMEPRTTLHNVTHSIYVQDPDGHTVELYSDRWENGFEAMRTLGPMSVPMDIETGERAGPA